MNKNKLGGEIGSSRAKVDGINLTRLLSLNTTKTNSWAGVLKSATPGAAKDEAKLSLGGSGRTNVGLNFGKAPKSSTNASAGSPQWGQVLTKAVAGSGSAGTLGNGVTGLVGGIGGIFSSLFGLFGRPNKTLAPLPAFQLPTAQNSSVSIGNGAANLAASERTGTSSASSISANLQGTDKKSGPNPTQKQNQQIVQAVKLAVLNSSSLNDVIAEI